MPPSSTPENLFYPWTVFVLPPAIRFCADTGVIPRASKQTQPETRWKSPQMKGKKMALYKNANYLTQTTDSAFDTLHKPGETTPHSGIFRCEGCGNEIVSESWKPMPPQNHHTHTYSQGDIQWRLIVRTK
ncbi:MAG: hypothetical protein ABSD57_04930 [Verrucomicrobiota bacterium]